MKEIIVHSKKYGNKITIIDDVDYDTVCKFHWMLKVHKGKFYVHAKRGAIGNKKCVFLHRLILQAKPGNVTDHIDGNPLNNLRNNLRLTDCQHNAYNRIKSSHNTTGFKGVYYVSGRKKFWAYIKAGRKRYGGGLHSTALQAAKKYNELALKHHGEFANLNKI